MQMQKVKRLNFTHVHLITVNVRIRARTAVRDDDANIVSIQITSNRRKNGISLLLNEVIVLLEQLHDDDDHV